MPTSPEYWQSGIHNTTDACQWAKQQQVEIQRGDWQPIYNWLWMGRPTRTLFEQIEADTSKVTRKGILNECRTVEQMRRTGRTQDGAWKVEVEVEALSEGDYLGLLVGSYKASYGTKWTCPYWWWGACKEGIEKREGEYCKNIYGAPGFQDMAWNGDWISFYRL